MRLYLIRHAKTEPQSASGKDFDRKLLPRGIQQSIDLSKHIKEAGFFPKEVLCSSAMRTRQTLSFLEPGLSSKIAFLDELYLCPCMEILKIICQVSANHDLMVIGHNEGISDLASYLTDEFLHLKTGTMIVLDFPGRSWSELTSGSAKLIHSYRSSVR